MQTNEGQDGVWYKLIASKARSKGAGEGGEGGGWQCGLTRGSATGSDHLSQTTHSRHANCPPSLLPPPSGYAFTSRLLFGCNPLPSFSLPCQFGLFHGDPHPGNIFCLRDGRIAYVDFGNVAQLSARNKAVLIDAVVHAVNEDYRWGRAGGGYIHD